MSLPTRGGARRRTGGPPVRRASAGISAGRIAAGVVAIAMVAALYGVAHSSAFALDRVQISGARFTGEPAVVAALGLDSSSHPNLFTFDTERARAALLALPAVTDAEVRVGLPRALEVRLIERVPILAWSVGGHRWLVDVDGVVLGRESPAGAAAPAATGEPAAGTPAATGAPSSAATPGVRLATPPASGETPRGTAPGPTAGGAPATASASSGAEGEPSTGTPAAPGAAVAASGQAEPGTSLAPGDAPLPVFVDQRADHPTLAPGARLDATDLDVARHIGALTPAVVGSAAPSLIFAITDRDGFTVRAAPAGWRAIFGIYTATLRPPALIPAQVQCLRSLLESTGETRVQTVYLFPEGDQCGTFTARENPP